MSDGPATLITCHANADFDAFAAMLAARLLYGRGALYFPGSQERPLQKVYAELDKKAFDFVDGSPDWSRFERLVIVDTRQRGRVRHVEPLLERPGIYIEVWDHHPDSGDDVKADAAHVAQVGAVTTLLAHALREQGRALTPEDATLLGLGIYGDTGSFTYSSTTNGDFLAAVWLLEQGMNVRKISEMASHELTSLHIQTLNRLLESAQTYTVDNSAVVLAEVSLEHYLGDFATLAHKLMEMEKISVLFAIGRMGDRVQVVARSHDKSIDVGKICAALGGGGHSYAASASIRGLELEEVRQSILRRLQTLNRPSKAAREYMSSPAIGIDAEATLREANELMARFGLKSVPVFKHDTHACAGLLDAHMAAKAVSHGLDEVPVREYMKRYIRTLPPDAALQELSDIIVGDRQRMVPIVQNNEVIGVVSRTDLINLFANEPGLFPARKDNSKERFVGKHLREHLSPEIREILALAGQAGIDLGLPVYAVGGFVRDVLLEKNTHDIDLVVEGNGIALARELARQLNGRVREHQKFLTSVVIYHNKKGEEARIDVATARLEYYESPAALPTVELSSLKMDSYRRDFSINALAVRLDGENYGLLADFFGGWQDVKDRTIRVLHALSFVEDPTRCLRAVRFEQRYAFRIGTGTEKLIKNALSLKLMDRLSSARLFNEFRHICDEINPPACFVRLQEIGVLSAIDPALILTPSRAATLNQLKETLAWYALLYLKETAERWLVYFFGLVTGMQHKEAAAVYDSLGLPATKKQSILRRREQLRRTKDNLLKWQKKEDAGHARVSELCGLLRGAGQECLVYFMSTAGDEGLKKTLSRYITQWSKEKPDITGDDLRRLGLAPGPAYGRILQAILEAKLDGAMSVESQFRLARKLVEEAGKNQPINEFCFEVSSQVS